MVGLVVDRRFALGRAGLAAGGGPWMGSAGTGRGHCEGDWTAREALRGRRGWRWARQRKPRETTAHRPAPMNGGRRSVWRPDWFRRRGITNSRSHRRELRLVIGQLDDFARRLSGGLQEADWAMRVVALLDGVARAF